MMHRLTPILLLLAAALLLPAAATAQRYDKGPELDLTKDYFALIVTNKGRIALDLFEDEAPITVKNFVNLAEGTGEFRDPANGQIVKRPYFDGVIFHRVIPSFMIQGGDPQGTGTGGPGYNIPDEFDPTLNFDRPGLLAMANTGRPSTGGSQFFITEVPTPHLNQRHTIFGEIVEGTDGLDVVKSIARVPAGRANKPNSDVVMEKVKVFRFEDGKPLADIRQEMAAWEPAGAPKASPEEAPATN